MRIISKPNNEVKCGHCRTHFEFDNSDMNHKVEPPGYDEYENRDVYYVVCPTCSKHHSVNASQFQKEQIKNRSSDY